MNTPLSFLSRPEILVLSMAIFIGGGSAKAQLVWDPAKDGGSNPGGNGAWSGANNWYNSTSDTNVTWPNTTNPSTGAEFTGTGGDVTLGNAFLQVGPLDFNSGNWELTGGTFILGGSLEVDSGTVQLGTSSSTVNITLNTGNGSPRIFSIASGADLQLYGSLGSGSINLTGGGELDLNSSSTFTFGLAISDGTVVVNNANAVGTGPLVVNNGGTLNLFGTGTTNTLTLGVNNLPSGNSFTLNKGGILNLTLEGDGTSDAINAAAKGVSLAGTLQLDGTINYSDSYTLFTDFNTLSDSNLAIIGYDTTDYAAKLSSTGTLSFIPQEVDVPEPSTFPLFGLGLGVVGTVFYFRRVRSSAAL